MVETPQDPPKTLTIPLADPVEHKGKTYDALTFRRRKAKDLVAMEKVNGDSQQHMALLASMADVPLPVILELDSEDYERITDETVALMGKRTTETIRGLRQDEQPEGMPVSSE
ncbi:hypothetical protein AN189_07220 [Loktanella sp. 3ANDIMAR09]|uniref:phage tail assembly protein n=1 Tax=Loktanella sp. 3ANDIMAR09 TaxID=1225657 RepID=UPI0006FD9A61|nr:phage tail assembly protein [Loktanella sp. 3ANDIMAR09]KQI68691.1 hypothetical protein AN189_07220 [Loktanella sp. 3ANDIMAR09]